MSNIPNPLDTIIEFAWSAGADRTWVNDAKDELKRLREELESYRSLFATPVAWARTNERKDLFDLRLNNNPHVDQSTVVPLFTNNKNYVK